MDDHKIVVPHSDSFVYPNDNTVLWNQNTVSSEDFKLFLQKKEELRREEESRKRLTRSVYDATNLNHIFLTFQDLCNFQNFHKWADSYLQTVGCIKCGNKGYGLYPLYETDECISLKFNAYVENAPCRNVYAQIFGFSRFYRSPAKILPIHPQDADAQKLYQEIQVNTWLKLDNLEHARRAEDILYKINYCRDVKSY